MSFSWIFVIVWRRKTHSRSRTIFLRNIQAFLNHTTYYVQTVRNPHAQLHIQSIAQTDVRLKQYKRFALRAHFVNFRLCVAKRWLFFNSFVLWSGRIYCFDWQRICKRRQHIAAHSPKQNAHDQTNYVFFASIFVQNCEFNSFFWEFDHKTQR